MSGADDTAAADHMEAPAVPTGPALPPIQQDPGLAGTQLLTEIPIGPDLRLQALTNGTFNLVNQFTTSEIDRATYDSLLSSHQTKARTTHLSLASDVTGLASKVSVKSEEDAIEWGDIDPQLAQRLRSDPEALRAFKHVRHPPKQARLDPAAGKFAPVPEPPRVTMPSSSSTLDAVSAENLQAAFQSYHSNQVSPALQQLQALVQQDLDTRLTSLHTQSMVSKVTLQTIESDLHKRTVIIHGVPPFSNKRSIDDNLSYLLYDAELTLDDVQSVYNHLLTTSSGFMKVVMLRETPAKFFFTSFRQKRRYFRTKDPNNPIPDAPIKIERDMSVLERLERQPLMALIDSYTKGTTESQPSQLYEEYLKPDFNSLQLWSGESSELIAQVLYIPQKKSLLSVALLSSLSIVMSSPTSFQNIFRRECSRPLDTFRLTSMLLGIAPPRLDFITPALRTCLMSPPKKLSPFSHMKSALWI